MKKLIGIVLILSAFCEGSVLSFPLTITIAISYAINWPRQSAFLFIVAGLLLDVFTPRIWGVNALFFMLMLVLLNILSAKISGRGILFYSIFTVVTQSVYSLLFSGGFDVRNIFGATLVSVCMTVLYARFGQPESERTRLAV